jgi:hypothetical protein
MGLLPDWIYYVGIFVMVAGIAFRQWAIAVLGRYFSDVIGVQAEQKVVEKPMTGKTRALKAFNDFLRVILNLGIDFSR